MGVTIITCLVAGFIVLLSIVTTLSNRFQKIYHPKTPGITIPGDAYSIKRGGMLSAALCSHCHGTDLAGMEIYNDKRIGVVCSYNITPGGVTKAFSNADWINAIRFGIKENGEPVFIMPSSDDYNKMSDYDLGCLIAYLKTVKPSDKKWPRNIDAITLYGKFAIQTGKFGAGLFSAETIDMNDHSPRKSPVFAETPSYGSYLVTLCDCRYCHGPRLSGGIDTGTTTLWAPNLTPGGDAGHWTADQFIQTIRSGTTPSGKHLNPEYMPWPYIAVLDDTAIRAIFSFLKAQPVLKDTK
jgi:cytochrome c553